MIAETRGGRCTLRGCVHSAHRARRLRTGPCGDRLSRPASKPAPCNRSTQARCVERTAIRSRHGAPPDSTNDAAQSQPRRAAVRHAFPLIRSTDDPACKPPFDDDRRPRISPRAEPVQTQAPARTRAAQGARIRDRAHRERKGSGDTRALATSTAGCCRLPKTGIARRCATEKEKPRKSENSRGLFRHFWRRRSNLAERESHIVKSNNLQ